MDAVTETGPEGPRPRKAAPGIAVLGGAETAGLVALLRAAGASVQDGEPAPEALSDTLAARYGFGQASLRTGPIGHLRLIRQLVDEAYADAPPQAGFWLQPGGSLADPRRAAVDPEGLPDLASAVAYRAAHLAALRRTLAASGLLVLCLSTASGLVDATDGTLYPDPPAHLVRPKGVKLTLRRSKPEDLDQDFTALCDRLRAHHPDLRLRLVIRPAGADDKAAADEATLRALAASWTQRFPGVAADPVFDHLLHRATVPPTEAEAQRLGPVLAGLLEGRDLLDLLQGSATAPLAAAAPADRAARRERRKQRENRRQKAKPSSVVCEDELLEAFS